MLLLSRSCLPDDVPIRLDATGAGMTELGPSPLELLDTLH